MRAVIQRVKEATVTVDDQITGKIQRGFLILLGIGQGDNTVDIDWLCKKIVALRVFDDNTGAMNLSLDQIQGDILVVSQFTLHASTKKGNRPSFIQALPPAQAIPLYEAFVSCLKELGNHRVETGVFGAHMDVQLVNDGPVTIIMDTKNKV
jgi:D-tyrosyl-tRNA(Tyr) deacylase